MPKGIGRPSNKVRRSTRKSIERTEKTYGEMNRGPYGKSVMREARDQLVRAGDEDLRHRARQAVVEREYLMSPSAIAAAAKSLAARQAEVKRARASPDSITSTMVPVKRVPGYSDMPESLRKPKAGRIKKRVR